MARTKLLEMVVFLRSSVLLYTLKKGDGPFQMAPVQALLIRWVNNPSWLVNSDGVRHVRPLFFFFFVV